jgi:hypothetical protein
MRLPHKILAMASTSSILKKRQVALAAPVVATPVQAEMAAMP